MLKKLSSGVSIVSWAHFSIESFHALLKGRSQPRTIARLSNG